MKFVWNIRWFGALFCLALSLSTLEGADRRANGAAIYRKLCASCHGRNGEGVDGKDKYKDPLEGDWSIEKLARYIEKNMPEDHPGKCVGLDAEAVARYINDAFYSREARARNHPARVELVRLTNRQYLNTIADLLEHFTGGNAAKSEYGQQGLLGDYYNSHNFNGDKKLYDRVDAQINFNFGEGGPEKNDTNEFGIKWRGSVIADETGTYEFILKTENGARLWINDEEDPIIDAWVASGQLNEHKATMRLIGGRDYPLRIECFKFKEKNSSIALRWKAPHRPEQVIPARNLSTGRAKPTFVVATPFPPDDSSVGYERGVAISKAWDEATTYAAIEVANHVVKHLDALSGSKVTDTNRAARVEAFCHEFVTTAFRRPLDSEQTNSCVSTFFKTAPKLEDSVKRVIILALKSPRFLYLGLDDSTPDDFEVASRLSFGLWDSMPDKALFRAAAKRELRRTDQITAQTRRMLSDPRAHAKMNYFLQQWLQVNRVEDLGKDPATFPEFTPEIITDLRSSLDLFLDDVVWSEPSDYRQLLLANYLYLNDRLAKFYGVCTNLSPNFTKVSLDPKERCGVLTHPYLLAAFSYQKASSPIHRGVFLTRNIVGRALKPPPMAVVFRDADFAPNLTMREKVTELTRPQACQSCHSVINPLGFSLEQYDAVGKFRVTDNGREINALSDYIADNGKTVHLSGPRDLAEFAVSSGQAQNAFIEQLFHQLVKQPVLAYGPDVMGRLRQSFVASGFNMQNLMVDIAAISALHRVEKPIPTRK